MPKMPGFDGKDGTEIRERPEGGVPHIRKWDGTGKNAGEKATIDADDADRDSL